MLCIVFACAPVGSLNKKKIVLNQTKYCSFLEGFLPPRNVDLDSQEKSHKTVLPFTFYYSKCRHLNAFTCPLVYNAAKSHCLERGGGRKKIKNKKFKKPYKKMQD